jgi:hypothetical protein
MKTLLAELNSPHPHGGFQVARRTQRLHGVFVLAAAVLLVPAAAPVFGQQAAQPSGGQGAQAQPEQNVECVLGLEHIKHHAKGRLTVEGDSLQFATEKGKANVPIASIQDIFTGKDSQQVFRGVGGTIIKAGVPYEGGRILSLFSHATEVLTVEYRDADNGYHGAVFVLPKGQATVIKRQLVAKGAKASIPPEEPGKTEEKKP